MVKYFIQEVFLFACAMQKRPLMGIEDIWLSKISNLRRDEKKRSETLDSQKKTLDEV